MLSHHGKRLNSPRSISCARGDGACRRGVGRAARREWREASAQAAACGVVLQCGSDAMPGGRVHSRASSLHCHSNAMFGAGTLQNQSSGPVSRHAAPFGTASRHTQRANLYWKRRRQGRLRSTRPHPRRASRTRLATRPCNSRRAGADVAQISPAPRRGRADVVPSHWPSTADACR